MQQMEKCGLYSSSYAGPCEYLIYKIAVVLARTQAVSAAPHKYPLEIYQLTSGNIQ